MANVRKSVPDNLIKWDLSNNPLAPLTPLQKEHLSSIEEQISNLDPVHFSEPSETSSSEKKSNLVPSDGTRCIDSYQELLQCYSRLEEHYVYCEDTKYINYLQQLQSRHQECEDLCRQIGQALQDFSALSKQYSVVSGKTTSLHNASEQLLSDQEKLSTLVSDISTYVKYYKEADLIMDKLEAPSISVNSESFFSLLSKIDDNTLFIQNHPSFRESSTYLVKYRHCLTKATMFLQNYVFKTLDIATQSILAPNPSDSPLQKTSDAAAMALFYGRFQAILPKVKPVLEQIEIRSYKCQEYDALLLECHQHYLGQRGLILGMSVQKGLQSIKDKYNGDHCSLVRHSCALLLHASIDEHRLFYQFFSKLSPSLDTFLESLCTSLYDTLRPFIIHIYHLETLAEICCILRVEMLDEHVQSNSEALQGFGAICLQLLHDVQERLVFRANLYLQSDVLGYKPSPGDLAYPQKLKMMQDIAESLQEESRQLRMKRISLCSMESGGSLGSVEPVSRMHLGMDGRAGRNGNSPADLHGMWYPTVRRTLVCLSRLYRCVDRPVFQSLSQEAIMLCVQSIEEARVQIETRSSVLDGQLFQVKHLLILREQIAPFQVDLTVKEYSLDFSKVRTAAFSLLEKRSRLFTISNNALLEFLLESAPQMKEQLIDSRKHVDGKLKSTCQNLIQHVTGLLIEPVIRLLEKESLSRPPPGDEQANLLGSAQDVAAFVSEALRLIRFKLPSIQQSMQLYLANRETECILFRPIKNNIVAAFTQLSQLLGTRYSPEELLLIACPLPEQVSIMLSSTTLSKAMEKSEAQGEEGGERKPKADGAAVVDGAAAGDGAASVGGVAGADGAASLDGAVN